MNFPVQERPLDLSFAQPQFGGQPLPDISGPLDGPGANAGDFFRSQYYQNPWHSGYGVPPSQNLLQQLYQMLQQFFGGQNSGEQYFQNASGGSVGDPHLSFNGQTWNNMGSQPDLLHSDSIPGSYQLSTQTTAPAANGVTYNQSATVTTNDGATSVTMDNSGHVNISQFGNSFALQPGASEDLGNGQFVQRNQDGSLVITCNNGTGGNITTTMRSNGTGIDVNTSANNVDLGGALVNGPNSATAAPLPMPVRERWHDRYTNYNGLDFD
ncbi:MAG: hypothetical protein JO322_08545 [Candidatus Eremiobacteraeota bacterium]|nr:hypothetical protein [Candidatus Eremiobacteraeota bacterium]